MPFTPETPVSRKKTNSRRSTASSSCAQCPTPPSDESTSSTVFSGAHVCAGGEGGNSVTFRSPRPTVTSAATIRSRFLHSLGVVDAKRQCQSSGHCANKNTGSHRTVNPNKQPSCYETLKGDYGQPVDDDASNMSTSTTTTAASCSMSSFENSFSWPNIANPSNYRLEKIVTDHGSQRVSFDTAVAVYPIPRRDAYSNRVKCLLWQSPSEMQENAARNCFEFASEGWDWQKALLDEDMIEVEGGERIHPIHFLSRINDCESMRSIMATSLSQPR